MTLSRSRPVTRLIRTAIETTPAERTTLSLCAMCEPGAAGGWGSVTLPATVSLSVLFEKVGNRHDPGVIVRHFILLVGRMQSIVGKSEAHEDGRNPQVFREISHDGNRPAAANENGFLPQDIAKGLRG